MCIVIVKKCDGDYMQKEDEIQKLCKEYSKIIDTAIRFLDRISSADGSGHADLARCLERMRDQAISAYMEERYGNS